MIFGSQTLWTDLLAHGLVDELDLMIGPKIVAGEILVSAAPYSAALAYPSRRDQAGQGAASNRSRWTASNGT